MIPSTKKKVRKILTWIRIWLIITFDHIEFYRLINEMNACHISHVLNGKGTHLHRTINTIEYYIFELTKRNENITQLDCVFIKKYDT